MKQEEFEKLSFEECKSLNGEQETEAVLEAWRAGYIYLQRKLKQMSETMYNEEFTNAIIELSKEELDCFKTEY
jgi:hemoglobin-like flavoprotein